MSDVLGVSKKTIEKWEQGKNPITGAIARLVYLLNESPELISKIYKSNIIEGYTDELDKNKLQKKLTFGDKS